MRSRALKSGLGIGGDDAVGQRHQRFPVIGFAHGVGTVEMQRIAARLHGLLETAKPHVDRRDHLPAAAVARIALKVGFDLRHQCIDRSCFRRRRKSCRKRRAGKLRRADCKIKRENTERQRDQAGQHRGAAASLRRPQHALLRLRRIGRRDQPARDLDARRFRFGVADQPSRAVALKLVELIAIDGDIGSGRLRLRAAAERPQHREYRGGRHHRQNQPQRHEGVSLPLPGTATACERSHSIQPHASRANALIRWRGT